MNLWHLIHTQKCRQHTCTQIYTHKDTHTDIRTLATVSISPRKESNVENHQEGFTAQIPRLDHKYCLKSGQPTSALISPRTAYLSFYFFFNYEISNSKKIYSVQPQKKSLLSMLFFKITFIFCPTNFLYSQALIMSKINLFHQYIISQI